MNTDRDKRFLLWAADLSSLSSREKWLYSYCIPFWQILFWSFDYSCWILLLPPPPMLVLPSSVPSPPLLFPSPCCLPPSWPWLDSGEIEADVPGAHNCPQPYPQHLPFVLDQQLTPRKNWPYRHAHTYKEHRCTNLYWLNSCPLLNEQYTHTHAHTHAHAKCCPNLFSVPDSSHGGVRSGVSIQGWGSLWAAGLANPDAGGHRFSN